jgi:hypothetical protein
MKKSKLRGSPSRMGPRSRSNKNWRSRPGNEAEKIEDELPDVASEEGTLYAKDVVWLLQQIAHHRQSLDEASQMLQKWQQNSDEFADAWREFLAAGGLTAADWSRWVECTFFRRRRVRIRKHLRLVVNQFVRYRLKAHEFAFTGV